MWKVRSSARTHEGDTSPVTSLEMRSIRLAKVESHEEAQLWNMLVSQFHYLHSSRVVGRQIKYLVYAGERPIACIGWGDASWALKIRDQWIGWTVGGRERRLHLVINNVRFLILPWVKVKNLASYVLARSRPAILDDWEAKYGFRPLLLETFVDIQQFQGTCYRAENWLELGVTSGYAKKGNSHHNSQAPKALFVYPAARDAQVQLKGRRI